MIKDLMNRVYVLSEILKEFLLQKDLNSNLFVFVIFCYSGVIAYHSLLYIKQAKLCWMNINWTNV